MLFFCFVLLFWFCDISRNVNSWTDTSQTNISRIDISRIEH